MTRARLSLIATFAVLSALLVALPGSQGKASAATTTEVYEGKSGAYHQQRFDALAPAGYRMTSLSVYGDPTNPVYAATWLKTTGPAWNAVNGIHRSTWLSTVNSNASNGFYPTIVTATGNGSATVYAGVFTQFSGSGIVPHTQDEMTPTEFRDENDYMLWDGYSLLWADVYGTTAAPKVIAAWWPRTSANMAVRESNSVDATDALTPNASTQAQADAMYKQGMRLDIMADNGAGNRLLLWRDDFPVGGYITQVGMTPAQFDAKVSDLSAHGGWFPIHVDGGGKTAAGATLSALWVVNPAMAARSFTKAPTSGSSTMAPFDNYMQTLMSTSGAREGELAITRGDRLVYARGYGWTEAGGAVPQPNTVMRIASCTKPITSIAIQQLVEGGFSRSTKVYSYIYPGGTSTDPTNKTVTVDELLYHAGGQVTGPSGDNAMFDDVQIASDLGLSLPISKYDVMHRMATLAPDYTPGTNEVYSNYGYSLLGQVIEKRTGQLYGTDIVNKVFTPLHITDMTLAASENPPSSEPRYEAMSNRSDATYPSVYLTRNVMTSSTTAPLVPWQYGGFNIEKMDSHGSWVGSAVDLARIMASFDAPDNPLFTNDATSRSAMWTRASTKTYPSLAGSQYDNTFRGFFQAAVPKSGGGTLNLVWHNGSVSGTSCLMAHRSDGLTFSVLLNRDVPGLLQGSVQGKDLSNIANSIVRWPTVDTFPTYGMPSFG